MMLRFSLSSALPAANCCTKRQYCDLPDYRIALPRHLATNPSAASCRLSPSLIVGRFVAAMNIPSSDLRLKVAAICVLSLGWSPLLARAEPSAGTPAPAQTSRAITQQDYDEPPHAAGSVKPEELPALQQKASGGDLQSQLVLGMLYQLGCGVVKEDVLTELSWYHKAADQGSLIAETQI